MSVYNTHGFEIASNPSFDSFLVGMTDVFKKCICIGDSLTAGTGVKPFPHQTYTDCVYPSRLAKVSGMDVTNAGVAGANPTSWYSNEFTKYTYTEYDVCLIELGTNQGLTDTITTDTNAQNTSGYANTHTGYYCRIVEEIKSANPKIFIALVISPKLEARYANVILKIASKYSVPVIDLRKPEYNLGDVAYRMYKTSDSDPHNNSLGYAVKASAVYRELCNAIVDNAENIATMLELYF